MIEQVNGLRLEDLFEYEGTIYWVSGFPTRHTVCGLERYPGSNGGKMIKVKVKDVEKVE